MKVKVILKSLLVFFLVLMILSFSYIIFWFINNKSVKDIMKKEEKLLIQKEDSYLLDEQLFIDNKNTIGWIMIEGTNISYPIVQYKDNNYYLNHDFYNNYNEAGWIFMDYRNRLNDQNILIYGHHRNDNNVMFGDIDKLFEKDFYDNNKGEISFITKDSITNYKIFSVYSIDPNDKYLNTNFEDFNTTIKVFHNRSLIKLNINFNDIDQIITLSTCSNNNHNRLVVQGYKKSEF